jgi:DNA invertase Pin-like site-specific DNA recombinase
MESNQSKNALTIIRVSTSDQARYGGSIEAQKEWINHTVIEKDLTVIMSIEDVFSGDNVTQKNSEEIIRIHKTIGIDYVVVYSLDRFSRKSSYGSMLLEKLNEIKEIKIITSTGIMDLKNAQDKMMASVQLMVAEMDQNTRKSSIKNGVRSMMKKRQYPGKPPFGYYKDERTKKVYPKKWCSEVMNNMFNIFEKTKNSKIVAQAINNKYMDVIGRRIYPQNVLNILSNPIYRGLLKWTDVVVGEGDDDNPFKDLQVISEEKFNRAQNILKTIESVDKMKTGTLNELVDEYGSLVLDLPFLKISCRNCGDTNLTQNGTEKVQGFIQRKYICNNCHGEFRVPGVKEIRRLKNQISLNCNKCGVSQDFVLTYDSFFYQLRCKQCQKVILLSEFVDTRILINQDKPRRKNLESFILDSKQMKLDKYI